MRATKNMIAQQQRLKPFFAESGANWSIWRDPATRDYAVYVGNQYIGSRKTLGEAQALKGTRG